MHRFKDWDCELEYLFFFHCFFVVQNKEFIIKNQFIINISNDYPKRLGITMNLHIPIKIYRHRKLYFQTRSGNGLKIHIKFKFRKLMNKPIDVLSKFWIFDKLSYLGRSHVGEVFPSKLFFSFNSSENYIRNFTFELS